MSDVLIKGMEMPTRCDDCVMGHELAVGTSVTGYGCLAMLRMGDARIRPISCGTRPDWCPLAEVATPHGRLIDADAIPYIFGSTHATEYDTVTKFVINKLPTIIEAEGT